MRIHVRSPWLAAFLAAFVAILIATLPNVPAFAAEVQEQAKEVVLVEESQTFSVPAAPKTTAPAAEQQTAGAAARDEFTVTVVTVVQWPSSDHTVTDQGDFGPRWCAGCSSYHQGDDFNPGGGTPVEVVADGVVISAGWEGALGEAVFVKHTINGQTVVTKYGHMQAGSLRVHQGQHIDRGTVLGLVGSTGASTGNHLHFQVEIGGVPINPLPWLHEHVNDDQWPGL